MNTLKSRVRRLRIDLRKAKERQAIYALIALALRPECQPEPTDEDIAQFLRECDEGKHRLNAESKAALDEASKRFKLELLEHMEKHGNDIYGSISKES